MTASRALELTLIQLEQNKELISHNKNMVFGLNMAIEIIKYRIAAHIESDKENELFMEELKRLAKIGFAYESWDSNAASDEVLEVDCIDNLISIYPFDLV